MPAAPEEAAQGWVQALDLSPKPFSALWLSVVPKWSQRAYLQRRSLAHAIGNSLLWNGLSLYAMARHASPAG
jgi:hypothetical protein